MSGRHTPLFLDTGAFFARFNRRATEHDRARAVFDGIGSGELAYGPLLTSQPVLSEFATLMRRKVGHRPAVESLDRIRSATSINVLPLGEGAFDRSCAAFARYAKRELSFVDHTSGVVAADHGVDHVFTFDLDDFHTLGFVVVPADTGEG